MKSSNRGRNARSPGSIPAPGWWDITRRVANRLSEDNASVLSAGVAFYAVLAIFPALAAVVTLYALVSDPADIQLHFNAVSAFMPSDVVSVFNEQLSVLAGREEESLGFSLILGVLLATWSAHRGVDALVCAVTIAYLEKESRHYIRRVALTYVLTLGAVILVLATLALMVGIPAMFLVLSLPDWINALTGLIGWILFFSMAVVAISLLYRFAPPRRPARWRWLSPGAVVATVLWLMGSSGFSYYVSQFGNYNETYGTLSAIVVLLTWFYLTSYVVVLGASLNAEIEHQTRRDTTIGGDQPMGERGAYVADHLGK